MLFPLPVSILELLLPVVARRDVVIDVVVLDLAGHELTELGAIPANPRVPRFVERRLRENLLLPATGNREIVRVLTFRTANTLSLSLTSPCRTWRSR